MASETPGGQGPNKSDANYEYMWNEYQKILDRNKQIEANSIEIDPEPGFVVRVACELDGVSDEIQLVMNLCTSEYVGPPVQTPDPSGSGAMQVRLPMSCGPMKSHTDVRGSKCIVFDVVLNPQVVDRCRADAEFKENVSSFAFQNVQRKFPAQAASSFRYPKMSYMGTKPDKQRIRRPGGMSKVQEIGSASHSMPNTNTNRVASRQAPNNSNELKDLRNDSVDFKAAPRVGPKNVPINLSGSHESSIASDILKPKLFQAKIPKQKETPLTNDEKKLLSEFQKEVPDLKPSELRKAIEMFKRHEEEKVKVLERAAEELEMKKKQALVRVPAFKVFCKTYSGLKLRLENFLGKFYVRAAGFEPQEEIKRVPEEVIVYVHLPDLREGVEALELRLTTTNVILYEKEVKTNGNENEAKSRYSLKLKLPFDIVESKSKILFNKNTSKLSLRLPVNQPKGKSDEWRQRLPFQNPFVFKFVS